ncbi:MAG: SDR family oxidoreductase [Planctomycetaceae bacterium]
MELQGRTAIITGGAVRLGKAICLALAEEGCQIVLHYGHSEAEANATLQELHGLGIKCVAVCADLLQPEKAVKRIFDAALAEFGSVEILINNAAIFESGTLADLTDDIWNRHQTINLKSPVFLAKEFHARRKTEATESTKHISRGHIINIADWRGTHPVPGHLAYTVAKGGLVTLTKLLAQELGPDIQVNAIAPGAILPAPESSPEDFQKRADSNPLRQTGSPEDVTQALLFLLRSEFVTGEVIHVTGGEHL